MSTAELGWADTLGESVAALAWRPVGDILYAGSADGSLNAYQPDGDWLFSTQAHEKGVTRVCPKPDGKWLATAGEDGRVGLVDARTGEGVETLARDELWAEHLAWSADGKVLAGAAGHRIYVRNGTGKTVEWGGHPGSVGALAWARQGMRLASAANKGVYLWNVGSWDPVPVLNFPGAAISLAWNARGTVLAAGTQDGYLYMRVQRRGSKPKQLTMSGYLGKVARLQWHPQRERLATCAGTDVVIWDVDVKKGQGKAFPLRRHDRTVTVLAYAPDGRLLVSGDRAGRLCFWDGRGGVVLEMELGSEITALAWQPAGIHLAIGTVDGLIRLFLLGGRQ